MFGKTIRHFYRAHIRGWNYYIHAKHSIKPLSPKSASPRYIVTLTSYGRRIKKTTPYTLCSLFNQTEMPDKIVLWLAHGEKIPSQYSSYIKKGLEIKFCDDTRSYKKLIPALKEFPNDILITADDDVIYNRHWLEEFKNAYEKKPNTIYCHRAREISFDEEKKAVPYSDWHYAISGAPPNRLLPIGIGGVLYPPHSLDEHICDKKLFIELAPTGDDIWFWAMAKLKKTPHAMVAHPYEPYDIGDGLDALWISNIREGKNDIQFKAIIDHFPQILDELV